MYKLKKIGFIVGVVLASYLALMLISGNLTDAGRTLSNGFRTIQDFGNAVNEFVNAFQGG